MQFKSVLFLFILTVAVKGDNILVFIGGGTYSHKLSIWPLASALADKGHNVTVLSGHEKQPSENPKVHDLFSHAILNMLQGVYAPDRVRDRLEGKHMWVYDNFNANTVKTCETIMNARGDPTLDYVINEGKFDLIIDNMLYGECGVILAHQKKAKLILFASCPFLSWFHDDFGIPDESALIPDQSMDFLYPMSSWQRLQNYLAPLFWFLTRRLFVYPKLEAIMQKRYNLSEKEVPAFADMYRKTDLVFVASHYSTDFARSLPPFVVSIGGMHCFLPTEPLTGELKHTLDNAQDGAVLLAFGSTINLATLPPDIKASFFAMMRRFPTIPFIWRWDGPDPDDKPENLIISKWLPQFQILGHPNLKAFISHAGLNSLTEATYHGVPVILIPLFADQDYNGYRIEATEIGIRLEMREIDTDLLAKSLDQVLRNKKYARNMKAMSALFRDRPMDPIETAVFWTEFVLRHEDLSNLKPLNNLTFFQRRLWDVAAVLAFITVSALLLTLSMLLQCCKIILRLKRSFQHNCQSPNVKTKVK